MPCSEKKTKKYQTRKSPAFSAQECKGATKKGKNGVYVSKACIRWVKTQKATSKGTHYDVHDNGGRPFRVVLHGSTVSIYKGQGDPIQGDLIYDILVKTIHAKKVYVGKSTGLPTGADHKPGEAKWFVGNSILVHVSENQYVFIGHDIYEFQMDDEVDSYFSLVGRNDVPYPVLLGTDNVYFMLDHCYVPRTAFGPMKKTDWEDAYGRYYGWIHPMTGEKSDPKKSGLEKVSKKMKGVHVLVKRK